MTPQELKHEIGLILGRLRSPEWEAALFAQPPHIKSLESQVEWQFQNILQELEKPPATAAEVAAAATALRDAARKKPFDLAAFSTAEDALLRSLDRATGPVLQQERTRVLDALGQAVLQHQTYAYSRSLKKADAVLRDDALRTAQAVYAARTHLHNHALLELTLRLEALSPRLREGIDALQKTGRTLQDIESYLKLATAFASLLGQALAVAAKI